jgi:hypothetical protein
MPSSCTARVALSTVVGALLLAASTAPAASAATQRYAGPSGSGTDCTSAKPCSLAQAVAAAGAGDEVIVAPGDYPLPQGLAAVKAFTIHGVAGQPRPRLHLSTSVVSVLGGSTLRYVEVDHDPGETGTTLWVKNGYVDQVIAKGSAQPGSITVRTEKTGLIRNSVVVAPGPDGIALQTLAVGGFNANGTYRNVTAIAEHDGGVAIQAEADYGAYAGVLARNVIARGGPGGHSLEALTDDSGATAKIVVDHSNRLDAVPVGSNASIVDGGGNQSAPPAFAPGSDYRQAVGSPTIDAGFSEAIDGDFDVDGDLREMGRIDIGADEFVPAPVASTGSAGMITAHSARLTGSVDTHGAPTSYRFQYGESTTVFDHSTPVGEGGESGTIAAAASISGLTPSTTYHYRLVASNGGGTVVGGGRTFTTASVSTPPPPKTTPPPPSTTPSPSPRSFAGVSLARTRLSLRHRVVRLRLRCPAATVGRCSGRTRLTARRRAAGARTIRLGRARFSIAAGAQAKVKVRVSRAGRRLLAHRARIRARDVNAAHDGAGHFKRTATAVRIRRHR